MVNVYEIRNLILQRIKRKVKGEAAIANPGSGLRVIGTIDICLGTTATTTYHSPLQVDGKVHKSRLYRYMYIYIWCT